MTQPREIEVLGTNAEPIGRTPDDEPIFPEGAWETVYVGPPAAPGDAQRINPEGQAFRYWRLDIKNNLSEPALAPLPPIKEGKFDVEGRVTVTFQNPQLYTALMERRRSVERAMLNVMRPRMSKRAFQRMRGRWKADR